MDPDAESATATALYTKFSQSGTISRDDSAAHNLLTTTTSGYDFLQLLMHQHLQLHREIAVIGPQLFYLILPLYCTSYHTYDSFILIIPVN